MSETKTVIEPLILAGDCLEYLRDIEDDSIDAIVTDPPYGIGFMGKEWDSGKSFVERKAAKRNTFDHVGGNHNPSNSADAARTRRVESRKFGEWCELWTAECLRVLKPGGHLLAFGGTRTWHRLACAVEDAGFEVRDSIAWLYGSGFPKSLDVSKAIDKRPGVGRHAEFGAMLREAMTAKGYTNTFDVAEKVIGRRTGAVANWVKYQFPEAKWWPALRDLLDLDDDKWGPVIAEAERQKIGTGTSGRTYGMGGLRGVDTSTGTYDVTTHATPDAERWQGWGTALKPAFEPIVVARKPLSGTVAANVLAHGTGALNIDATRIGQPDGFGGGRKGSSGFVDGYEADGFVASTQGRWPANVVLGHTEDCEPVGTKRVRSQNPKYRRRQEDEVQDGRSSYVTPKRPEGVGIGHADADGTETVEAWNCAPGCPVADLDAQSGTLKSGKAAKGGHRRTAANMDEASEGGRIYGGSKGIAGTSSTNDAGVLYGDTGGASRFFYVAKAPKKERPVVVGEDGKKTAHPTVKPLALMRWLIRLVTPPGGIVLDPFAGSGTTVEAGMLEGFEVWAIESEADYLPLIQVRIDRVMAGAQE